MKNSSSLPALATRLNTFFQLRNARDRSLYVTMRQALNLPTFLARRAVAREITGACTLRIDREKGYDAFPPAMFPEVSEIVAAARDLGVNVDLERPGLSKKARSGFMVPMIDVATLDLSSPFLRLALRPDLIAAISSYLGLVPVLAHLNVYYSAAARGEKLGQSQLFHCDADDTAQVKIFVLCSEVTADNGPLTLLDAQTSQRLRAHFDYRFPRKVRDKEFSDLVRQTDHHPVVGPPGTVCLVDTSRCFHFGSRVEQGAAPRLVLMIQYLTPFSFELPGDFRKLVPFRHLAPSDMSRVQRMVLGAE